MFTTIVYVAITAQVWSMKIRLHLHFTISELHKMISNLGYLKETPTSYMLTKDNWSNFELYLKGKGWKWVDYSLSFFVDPWQTFHKSSLLADFHSQIFLQLTWWRNKFHWKLGLYLSNPKDLKSCWEQHEWNCSFWRCWERTNLILISYFLLCDTNTYLGTLLHIAFPKDVHNIHNSLHTCFLWKICLIV